MAGKIAKTSGDIYCTKRLLHFNFVLIIKDGDKDDRS